MRPGHLPTVSASEMVVLELLLDHDEMDGPGLVSASARRLEARTISSILRALAAKGLISSRPPVTTPAGRKPRRSYHLTAAGRRLFELWRMLRQQLRRIPA